MAEAPVNASELNALLDRLRDEQRAAESDTMLAEEEASLEADIEAYATVIERWAVISFPGEPDLQQLYAAWGAANHDAVRLWVEAFSLDIERARHGVASWVPDVRARTNHRTPTCKLIEMMLRHTDGTALGGGVAVEVWGRSFTGRRQGKMLPTPSLQRCYRDCLVRMQLIRPTIDAYTAWLGAWLNEGNQPDRIEAGTSTLDADFHEVLSDLDLLPLDSDHALRLVAITGARVRAAEGAGLGESAVFVLDDEGPRHRGGEVLVFGDTRFPEQARSAAAAEDSGDRPQRRRLLWLRRRTA